jgi:hypothetical protein
VSDLKKSADADIAIEAGDFVLVEGIDDTAQDIDMTLRTWLGECIYNRAAGMPYEQVIFAEGSTDDAIRFVIANRLAGIAGVAEVLSVEVEADRAARALQVAGRVRHNSGAEIPFSLPPETVP